MTLCYNWTCPYNVVLLFLLNQAAAIIYFKNGATVLLSPGPVTVPFRYVKWIHDGNIAADWMGYETTCFQQFEGRCQIDTETGNLTIVNLTVKDSGFYKVKMDGSTKNVTELKVIYSVLKPQISSKWNSERTSCILICDANITENMEPVWFFWTIDGVQRPGTEELMVTKESGGDFSCLLKNNVSSEKSTEMKNPFHTGIGTLFIFIIIFIFIFIIVGVALRYLLIFMVYGGYEHRRSVERSPEEEEKHLQRSFSDCNGVSSHSVDNVPVQSGLGGD